MRTIDDIEQGYSEPAKSEPRFSEILTEYYTTEPDKPKDLSVRQESYGASLLWKNPEAPVREYKIVLDSIPIDKANRQIKNNIMAEWDEVWFIK